MSGPRQPAEPPSGTPEAAGRPDAPGADEPTAPLRDGVTDLVRWAAFSCLLVPVVLLWCGTSFAGAAGTALGLAAVTGACRLLLRRSERVASRPAGEDDAVRSGRRHRAGPPGRGGGRHAAENTPVD
ncbi:hypothetical protein [Streptomyces pactum]|uniref:Uncharacterized protein n=1 Tax=Streptomyces pactum TaxID=68249 RepID=A0A1S6JCM0_9ACTN|nr:hypothetical protein [Streptomyces pactum]AQS69459.1 hypothetical protein B1H29_23490 [Streptomyces pactum]